MATRDTCVIVKSSCTLGSVPHRKVLLRRPWRHHMHRVVGVAHLLERIEWLQVSRRGAQRHQWPLRRTVRARRMKRRRVAGGNVIYSPAYGDEPFPALWHAIARSIDDLGLDDIITQASTQDSYEVLVPVVLVQNVCAKHVLYVFDDNPLGLQHLDDVERRQQETIARVHFGTAPLMD